MLVEYIFVILSGERKSSAPAAHSGRTAEDYLHSKDMVERRRREWSSIDGTAQLGQRKSMFTHKKKK